MNTRCAPVSGLTRPDPIQSPPHRPGQVSPPPRGRPGTPNYRRKQDLQKHAAGGRVYVEHRNLAVGACLDTAALPTEYTNRYDLGNNPGHDLRA